MIGTNMCLVIMLMCSFSWIRGESSFEEETTRDSQSPDYIKAIDGMKHVFQKLDDDSLIKNDLLGNFI